MQYMRTSAVTAGVFAFVATLTPTQNLAQEAHTLNIKDFCFFRNEVYSFGSIICIAKDRALACYPPQDGFESNHAHWRLLKHDLEPKPWGNFTLGDTCPGIAGPAP
jgi:hypothetical protein